MTKQVRSPTPIALHLRRAYFALNRRLEDLLAPHGLSGDQYRVLLMLKQHGECTQRTLVELLLSDPSTLGAIVRLLESRGYIRRQVDPDDRRARRLSFTAAGHRLFAKIQPLVERVRGELDEVLSSHERDELIRILAKIESHILARWSARTDTGTKGRSK